MSDDTETKTSNLEPFEHPEDALEALRKLRGRIFASSLSQPWRLGAFSQAHFLSALSQLDSSVQFLDLALMWRARGD